MQDLKILFLQSNLAWENPQQNRKTFFEKIEKSFSGEDIIILPETFTTGFPVDPEPFAEKKEGETMQWMKNIAAKFNTVLTGSFLMDNDTHYTNTLIVMYPGGNFKRYDKRHVFSMGGEHQRIKPGEKELIVDVKGWKIKPMICYDLRFPVWSKNRYVDGGFAYDLAIYTANWPAVRSFPWKQLITARAIENLAYVTGVNRVGFDGHGNRYSGDSRTVDFKGNILSECPPDTETSCKVTLSYNELVKFRKKFNVGPDWDKFKIVL